MSSHTVPATAVPTGRKRGRTKRCGKCAVCTDKRRRKREQCVALAIAAAATFAEPTVLETDAKKAKADTDTAAKWSPHFKFDKDHTLRDWRMVSTFNGTCDCGICNCTCLLQHCTSSVIAGGSGAASSSAPPSAAAASPEGGGQGRGDEAVSDATSGDGNEPASLPLVGKRSREEATVASEQLQLAVDAQHHERGGGDGSVTRQRRMEEGGARGAVESAAASSASAATATTTAIVATASIPPRTATMIRPPTSSSAPATAPSSETQQSFIAKLTNTGSSKSASSSCATSSSAGSLFGVAGGLSNGTFGRGGGSSPLRLGNFVGGVVGAPSTKPLTGTQTPQDAIAMLAAMIHNELGPSVATALADELDARVNGEGEKEKESTVTSGMATNVVEEEGEGGGGDLHGALDEGGVSAAAAARGLQPIAQQRVAAAVDRGGAVAAHAIARAVDDGARDDAIALRVALRKRANFRTRGCSKKANAVELPELQGNVVSRSVVAASSKELTEVLFSQASTLGSQGLCDTVLHLIGRPEVRELIRDKERGSGFQGKERQAEQLILKNLRDLYQVTLRAKGTRFAANEGMLKAVDAGVASEETKTSHLVTATAAALGKHRRRVRSGIEDRMKLEEMDHGLWKVKEREQRKDAVTDQVKGLIDKWMHEEGSTTDNNSNCVYQKVTGFDLETGLTTFEPHPYRFVDGTKEDLWDKLTGRDRFNPKKEAEPTDVWLQIVQLTTSEQRPKGIKGSAKMIKLCGCMRGLNFDNPCACPKCSSIHEKLDRFKKLDDAVRYAGGERRALPADGDRLASPAVNACTKCGGNCDEGTPYRIFPKSVAKMIETLYHEPLPIQEMDLPVLQAADDTEHPTEVVEFKLAPKPCLHGSCRSRETRCGYDSTFFGKLNGGVDLEVKNLAGEVMGKVRACPTVFTADGVMEWNEWQRIQVGTNKETDEPVMASRWLPRRGTRREFMFELAAEIKEYGPHYWRNQWHRQNKKRVHRLLFHRRALGTAPVGAAGLAMDETDFAAALEFHKRYMATCEHPETTHNNVHVVSHSPFLEKINDLPPSKVKTKLVKSGVTQRVRKQVTAFHAFCKLPGDTAYHAAVTRDIISLLNHGTPHHGSHGEWFYEGKRLPGSHASVYERDLPQGLEDLESADAESIADVPITTFLTRRDGCAKQYQGKNYFRWLQVFRSLVRDGVKPMDWRNPAYHGKCDADGEGKEIRQQVHRSVQKGENIGQGSRSLVLMLAKNRPFPSQNKVRMTVNQNQRTGVLYGVYPDDGSGFMLKVQAKDGYKGSSADHWYSSKGEDGDSELIMRENICTCAFCMGVVSTGTCRLIQYVGSTRSARIKPLVVHEAAQCRGGVTVDAFANALKKGDVVVARIHADERGKYPDENYFLGRVDAAPWQLEEAQNYAGSQYQKGWWVTKLRWYEVDRLAGSGGSGNVTYRLVSGPAHVFQINALVRGLQNLLKKAVKGWYNRGTKRYVLKAEYDGKIQRQGALSS